MKLGLCISRLTAAETIEAGDAIERYGGDSLWIAEDLWNRGAVPMASAVAARTERIRIGIGVVNPYTRHPTLLAMDSAVLSEMSGNRVNIGIGASVKLWVEQMGMEYKLPRTAVKEAIEICRAMLAGETVTYEGKYFNVNDVALTFPVEQPPGMYMAAMGERTVRTCGGLADGWIVSAFMPLGYVKQAMGWLREGAEKGGRSVDDIDVVQLIPYCCHEDSRTAKDAIKPGLGGYVAFEAALVESQPILAKVMQGHCETVPHEEYEKVVAAINAGGDPVDVVPDALVDELAIAGTPDECAERIARYEAAGVKELTLIPFEPVENAARTIGQDVLPLVRPTTVGG